MPAIYAHDRFGEEVVKTLPPSFAQLYEKYTEAFRLGFQGPDILFYHQPFKKNAIRTRSTQLHITSAGGKFFREQATILLQNAGYSEDKPYSVDEVLQANGARAAYIAGFLCHFSLDVACHPYIDGHSDEIFPHGKVESEFDKFVRRQKGVHLHGYNVAKDAIKPTGGCAETVAAVLSVPEENIRTVKQVRQMADKYGATVEAELGVVGGNEGDGAAHEILCTNPDDAKLFCDETGVDALAVAIGNAHGNYPVLPNLRFDVLDDINKMVETPLVLHGGTGITDEMFQQAIMLGVRKVNIATASFDHLAKYAQDYCTAKEKANYFELSSKMVEGVYTNVKRHIKVFSFMD